jgi:diguanylate cyclase (GGDEF)-like protein
MDELVLINDLQPRFKVYPIRSNTGEISMINSSIVAPIFHKGSLYGTMAIDSNRRDAYNEDDLVVMRFIRDNIQSIISNQLSFLERTNQALTDHMTGLYNRHFLAEHFNSLLERGKRYGERFCLAVFDINDLKEVNDAHGHLAGDLIIKAFAKTLQNHARRSDIVARFGGDEFMAIFLMSERTEIEEKLSQMSLEPAIYDLGETPITLTYSFSFGVATFPEDGQTYTDLINVADVRMYEYKSSKAKGGSLDG